MGTQQFYDPMKKSIDTMELTTDRIENLVNEMKTTDVSQLNTKVDGLTWWDKYTKRIGYQGQYVVGLNTNVLTQIYSVSGDGYIDLFDIIVGRNSTYFNPEIRIEVDGLTFSHIAETDNSTTGAVTYQLRVPNSNNNAGIQMYANSLSQILPNQTKINGNSFLPVLMFTVPIFFKTSFKIFVAKGTTYNLFLGGGLK